MPAGLRSVEAVNDYGRLSVWSESGFEKRLWSVHVHNPASLNGAAKENR